MQKLLLANIKSELGILLVGKKKHEAVESTQVLENFDDDDYAEQSKRELEGYRTKDATSVTESETESAVGERANISQKTPSDA